MPEPARLRRMLLGMTTETLLFLILLLLVLLIAGGALYAFFNFRRLAVIHALANSSMGAALGGVVAAQRTALSALRSDSSSKRLLAAHIGGREYIEAANFAVIAIKEGETALKEAELALQQHNRGQSQANKV